MADTLKVELDIKHVLAALDGLPASAMQAAWRRTLRKTANWIKVQTAKAVSKGTQIPQKVLKQRIYFFLRSKDSGKVWLGLNPIEAERLGTVRQTRKGVRAGRFMFEGAWLMGKIAPNGPVYQRVGKERLPYNRVTFDWSGEGDKAFRNVAQLVGDRLMVILRQEVNYEIQKAFGRAR